MIKIKYIVMSSVISLFIFAVSLFFLETNFGYYINKNDIILFSKYSI